MVGTDIRYCMCWRSIIIRSLLSVQCLEHTGNVQSPFGSAHISVSLFVKMNYFQLLCCSSRDVSKQLHWNLPVPGVAGTSGTSTTLRLIQGPLVPISLSAVFLSPNKTNWFQLPLVPLGDFSRRLPSKAPCSGRSVFVQALPIMSWVPTYRTPSDHDITGGDITEAVSRHHRGGGCW